MIFYNVVKHNNFLRVKTYGVFISLFLLNPHTCKCTYTEQQHIVYIFWGGLECVAHSFANVAHFANFQRCLDSNPESCCSKEARYQLSHPSPTQPLNSPNLASHPVASYSSKTFLIHSPPPPPTLPPQHSLVVVRRFLPFQLFSRETADSALVGGKN